MIKILFLFGAILLTVIFITSPLFRTEKGLQKSILKSVPMGTLVSDVKKYILKKGWKITQDRHGLQGEVDEGNYPYVHGSSFIQVTIGRYLGGYAYVEGFFGFDDENKLIDVKVLKTYDSL